MAAAESIDYFFNSTHGDDDDKFKKKKHEFYFVTLRKTFRRKS